MKPPGKPATDASPEATTPNQTPDQQSSTADDASAAKARHYRDEDFDSIHDDDDDNTDDDDAWFFTKSRVISYRNAFFLFLINLLPEDQRWAYFAVYLHTTEMFVRPLYTLILAAVFAAWYFPTFGVMSLFSLLTSVDGFRRRGDGVKNTLSRTFDFTTVRLFLWSELSGLHAFLSPEALDGGNLLDVIPYLEPIFGPVQYWPHVIYPLLPGLLFLFPRGSVNGFIPESRKQGIIIALFSRACMMVLPKLFFQWVIFGILATPDLDYPVMAVEFLVCFVVWQWLDVNIQAAYAAYLFINQWTHWTMQNKRRGAVPSALLLKERTGTKWFTITCLALRISEITWGRDIAELGTLDLGVKVWLPLLTVLVLGIYLLKYGLGIRLHKFRHRPIKGKKGMRLLRLHPQPRFRNSPLQCDIIHVKLGELPPYTAVSHRWGAPGETQEIILIDGAPLLVSSSIHSLLLAKRSVSKHVVMWIDSICIDQENETEKSRQVGLMRMIYEEATSTLGWLGNDPGADKAFLLVARLNQLKRAKELATLRQDKDAGWSELQHMLNNSWFERIWIIQEVAASTNPELRYGDIEFGWPWFANGLLNLLVLSGDESYKTGLDPLCYCTGYLNIMIMENIRRQVDGADMLKLNDILKLARGFHATLPVDKVYALLGIVEERNAPLFHPNYSRNDADEEGVSHIGHAVEDLIAGMRTMSEILGTVSGEQRTLRGDFMTKNFQKSLRHIRMLRRDVARSIARITRINKGKPDFEFRQMQANYSEQTTPERVFTVVARDTIRQGDYAAFVAHAGIGIPRTKTLKRLPSWAPDWTVDQSTFSLPCPTTSTNLSPPPPHSGPGKKDKNIRKKGNNETKTDYTEGEDDDEDPAPIKAASAAAYLRDGGSRFLHLKAVVKDRITHLAPLTPPLQADGQHWTGKRIRQDFRKMRNNRRRALVLATEKCRHYYKSLDAVADALCRTMLVDNTMRTPDDPNLETSFDVNFPIEPRSLSRDKSAKDGSLTDAESEWLALRQRQCSPNLRTAQRILTDIAPSFQSYSFESMEKRLKLSADTAGTAPSSPPASHFNIFGASMTDNLLCQRYLKHSGGEDNKNNNGTTVDYTLGRQLAITVSGEMALVPGGTEVGDVLVIVPEWRRSLVLRPAVAVFKSNAGDTESDSESDTEDEDDGQEEGQPPAGGKTKRKQKTVLDEHGAIVDPDKMARLVGEAYVDGINWGDQSQDKAEGQWFALW